MLIPCKHSGYVKGTRLCLGDKGGGGAPPPDPRLVDAQIRSMGIQDQMITRILENSEELMPLQREQLEFALDSQRTAFDQSQQDRTWMLGRRGNLTTMQDRMIEDANTFDVDQRGDKLAQDALADVGMQVNAARQSNMRGLQRRGVNPNSGKSLAMGNQMALGEAMAKSSAANKVREAARLEGYGLTDRAANALAGYPAMAAQTTGMGAQFGAAGLGLANTGLAGMNSGFGAAGGMAGQMGSNATNMWNAQAQYKSAQDRTAAESDPFNTILGAAAGVGSAWAMGKFF